MNKNIFSNLIYLLLIITMIYTSINAFDIYKVKGKSMEPTLFENDYVITVNYNFATSFKDIFKINLLNFNIDDLIVAGRPTIFEDTVFTSSYIIKRIIALPSEKINVDSHKKSNISNGDFISFFNNSEQVTIPGKGFQIDYDESHANKYDYLIIYDKSDSKVSNYNNLLSENYTFLNNFFFITGDNLIQSIDSRHFGPIPEKYIKGHVILKIKFKND